MIRNLGEVSRVTPTIIQKCKREQRKKETIFEALEHGIADMETGRELPI